MNLEIAKITFDNLEFIPRDAQKIRGYFIKHNKENDLFHNHNEDGYVHRYPLIQYKIINKKAVILSLENGVKPMIDATLSTKELEIDDKKFILNKKTIEIEEYSVRTTHNLKRYTFLSPYVALNQVNLDKYKNSNNQERCLILEKILIGNILSFLKNFKIFIEEKLICKVSLSEQSIVLKDINYIAFKGSFSVNIDLPDYIGIGKGVSKGFGIIEKICD